MRLSFRDAKQFAGLAHCQSTNKTKIENHVNLALGAVSVAIAAYCIKTLIFNALEFCEF